ncbi:MAG: hypothetical protein RXS42_07215 [Nitrososphaeria archaeon]
MMEVDKEYLEKIVEELKLKERLSKILSAQTKCPEGAAGATVDQARGGL